jgi:hypothetical protein
VLGRNGRTAGDPAHEFLFRTGRSGANRHRGPRLLRDHPADAERVPGRVCVDLKVVGGVFCRLEQSCAQCHDFVVSRLGVIYSQVEVNLLGRSMRPLGPDVVWCELDAHPWLTVDQHHVPVVLSVDRAAEHPSPESALGREIVSIERHDLMPNPHSGPCSHRPAMG